MHARLSRCATAVIPNPLSVYFCHRAGGELALVIYEVRNTFGDIHAYVLPVKPGELSDAGLRQQQEKLFHISRIFSRPTARVPCSPRPSSAAAAG